MKNRFSTMSQTAFGLCLLLSASGLMFSCSDDYDLDDKSPSFLGGSIYDELKAKGNFEYTLKLIDDLEYADVLSKTGSKTLFVANDDAFKKFFETTDWTDGSGNRISDYKQLSLSQKKLLLNNAMLNNAYVLEMMANCPNGEKNLCLRQTGAASVTDSVKFWWAHELPHIQTENLDYPNYWARYTNAGSEEGGEGTGGRSGIYMAVNNTVPMIVHFLEGQMLEKNITHDDVSFILGLKDNDYWGNDNAENRSYVFGARILPEGQDVVCMNGYFHEVDKVLVAPDNMAEVIRTNGETNIFSHILDRFSAPFYDADLTYNYKALYANDVDSVFVKRYFAVRTQNGQLLTTPDETSVKDGYPYLSFDPAWNQFMATESEVAEKNMGAMFVPSDEVLSEYFINGGGRVLLDRYATKTPVTKDNLLYNIDQIPLDIIQAMVNNLMKNSFNETVPSKYLAIMNDARDQMFPISDGYASVKDYKDSFSKVLLANNGVVYVMNKVVAPADYSSVIAPVLYSQNAQVMRAVVRADENYIQGSQYANAPLQTYFSTYLKAMQSRFSLFVPTDDGLGSYGYIDPASLAAGNSRNYMYWRYDYRTGNVSSRGKRLPIDAVAYTYNMDKGYDPTDKARGNTYRSLYNDLLTSTYGEVKKKLLIEMVNQHIVVHGDGDEKGMQSGRKYYLSRTGAPVVLKNGGDNAGVGMKVNGGFQEQLAKQGTAAAFTCNVTEVYDQSQETNGYGNGMTYFIDHPMQPTTNSVYKVANEMPSSSKFMELCNGVNDNVLKDAGLRDPFAEMEGNDGETKWQRTALLYYIFYQGEKGGSSFNIPSGDKLVRSFNNYRYTVYVPTDDAVQKEIDNGLPTWLEIEEYLNDNLLRPTKPEGEPVRPTDTEAEDYEEQVKEYEAKMEAYKSTPEYHAYEADLEKDQAVKLKGQAMINTLVNFLKYHFQDESIFVDNVNNTGNYMTACIYNGNYLNLHVEQKPGSLVVTDADGNQVKVSAGQQNLLARDSHYNATTNPRLVESSSYVVVHQIDDALHFRELDGGRWDAAWKSPKKAKAFLVKYGTQK